jgi:hypothetical protein
MRIQIRSRTLLFIFLKTFFVFIEVYFYKTRTFFLLLLAVCRSQDGVGGVMDVGEEPTAGAVPPAPVPGAAPAIRQPASTGQCPTCSRPRGGASHPPACINRSVSHLLPSPGRLQPSARLHQQVSVPPAPVPGAAPAIRPPASTGQCPTCSRPRGGSGHPPACINRSAWLLNRPHPVLDLTLKLGHFKIIMIFRKIW